MIQIDTSRDFILLADVVLLLHVLFAGFVIFGLLFIFIGKVYAWSWVRNPWFRLVHLMAITIVVIQSWSGIVCPLTSVEMELRSLAGDTVYSGSFISYWLERVLYYELPPWVFLLGYTIFGVVVVVSWFWVRPRSFTVAKKKI